MPGQFYSDKYIKHQRGAEEAGDQMNRAKEAAQQTASEEKEELRRYQRQMREKYKEEPQDG